MSNSIYLKIDPIKGTSQDKDHGEWIELHSLSQSASKWQEMGSNYNDQVGKPQLTPFACSKKTDKATPEMIAGCVAGQLFDEAEIHICGQYGGGSTPQQKAYIKYKLKNVRIADLSSSANSGDGQGSQDAFSLAYDAIHMEFIPIDTLGNEGASTELKYTVSKNEATY